METNHNCLFIINDPEVISSLLDKAKIFVMKFAFISTLDEKGYLLPDFPPFIEYKLCNISILAQDVSRLYKSYWSR